MSERLSRTALYELVWSEPMKTLAARFGISDVALKKTCARAEIPTPERGYWAKREAGKKTFQVALPVRAPGMDDEVVVAGGGDTWYARGREDLLGPLPPPPEFPEPLEVVQGRIAKAIGTVSVPLSVQRWHPAIDRLLQEDERRKEKQRTSSYSFSWEKPLFDTPFERRRLRILNSLFFATARLNGKPSFYGKEGRDISIGFYQQRVSIVLDRPKESTARGQASQSDSDKEPKDMRLCLSVGNGSSSEAARLSWQDDDSGKLETRMTEIAIQVVLKAEIDYREGAVRSYQGRIKRKVELEEEERRRKIEEERAERERQKKIEQGRIDRLLRDASAFHQARIIRDYVSAIRTAPASKEAPADQIEKWSQWALAQADRIDPALGQSFLKSMKEEEEAR